MNEMYDQILNQHVVYYDQISTLSTAISNPHYSQTRGFSLQIFMFQLSMSLFNNIIVICWNAS